MKHNTIFMYDTYTGDMYNYDIKSNVEFLCNKVLKFFLARRHVIMRSWHAFGMLARRHFERKSCYHGSVF